MRLTTHVRGFLNWCCVTWRRRLISLILLAGLFMAAGFCFGLMLFWIFGPNETLKVLQTVTLVGAVAAVWKVLADNWNTLWQFLQHNVRNHLGTPLGQLAIAVTGAGIVVGAAPKGSSMPPEADRPTLFIATSIIAGPDAVAEKMDTTRIMLPYFNTNADDQMKDTKEEQEKLCINNLGLLAKVDDAGIDTVQTLACGLRSCSTEAHPVKIDVRGFASSRSFTCGGKRSADRNLELAEKRRNNIVEILNGDLSKAKNCLSTGINGKLTYQPDYDPAKRLSRWGGDYELMERNRDLVDMSSENPSGVDRTREILTRRVDVVVLDKGACTSPRERHLLVAKSPPSG